MANQQFYYVADGKTYPCSFTVTDGKLPMVEVTTPWGYLSTQKGGSPAAVVARLMAGELYRKHLEMN
jgi:hypothetical protein